MNLYKNNSNREILSRLKNNNKLYFSKESIKFSNDISYKVLKGKKSEMRFLIIKTYGFSDMFDGIKKSHYRIKLITDYIKYDLSKAILIDDIFNNLDDVKKYLKNN